MKRLLWVGAAVCAVTVGLGYLASVAHADDAATKKVVEYYRRKANVPPTVQIEVKDLKDSPLAKGAKTGTLSAGGRNITFTMSDDGKYAVFGDIDDLSVDPFAGVMKKIDLKDKPARGPANAKVTIVEYSDFQCPFCSRGYQTMENQVLKEYGDKVRFIYKNFPLPMHPWAEPAAIATRCVLEQKDTDAYWKLYNFYFENQKDITPQNLKDKSLEVLKGSKVDAAKFSDCLDNKQTQAAVKAEMQEGSTLGVTGTPAFIINGRLISGAQPFDNFKAVIDDELARAK